jgi:hypothetical protein
MLEATTEALNMTSTTQTAKTVPIWQEKHWELNKSKNLAPEFSFLPLVQCNA